METLGRYKILEKLGEGGMGAVYKAFDPLLERTVALKIIAADLDNDPERRTRFLREARAVAQLSDPNIITIYDLGETDDRAFLAMQYLEGADLEARMARGESMSLDRKLAVMLEVCQGLAHAHDKGIIHRDVKPANIFITALGQVKILDFGLARTFTSDQTKTRTTMGTPSYMAPEQVRGERVDHRADIFSAGVVFYELLTGRKPFPGDSVASVIYKILEHEPKPIGELNADVPPRVAAAVHRALVKDADARYPAVGEMIADLRGSTTRSGSYSTEGAEAETLFVPASIAIDYRPARTPLPSSPPEIGPGAGLSSSGAFPQTTSIQRPALSPRWIALAGLAAAGLIAALWLGLGSRANRTERPEGVETTAAEPGVPPSVPAPPVVADRTGTPRGLADEAIDRRTREARSLYDAGKYEEAAAAVAEILENQPTNAPAAQLSREIAKISAAVADAARGQARDARSRADSAKAGRLAAPMYRTARTAETTAESLYRAGQFGDAAAKWFESRGFYQGAEAVARGSARTPAPPEVVAADPGREREAQAAAVARELADAARRTYDGERQRAEEAGAGSRAPGTFREALGRAEAARLRWDGSDSAGARDAYEAAASLMRDARAEALAAARLEALPPPRPLPPPPPPKPVETPRAPASDPAEARQAITGVLRGYRIALQAKDLAGLKTVWPALAGSQEEAIRTEFRNARSIVVSLDDLDIQLSGDTASVTCRRRYQIMTVDGHELQTITRTTFTLRKRDSVWVIDAIRHEPIR